MKWLRIARAVLMLLPALITAIKAIEKEFTQQGMGTQKLEAIRTILENIYKSFNDVSLSFEEIWPQLEMTVGVMVGLFNSLGWGTDDKDDSVKPE